MKAMNFERLKKSFKGDFFEDITTRKLYATDASAYREIPLAVAIPKDEADIHLLVETAHQNATSLIPRTAGTSLAGQVVGAGIVVDVSKYFNRILEYNKDEGWVRVQPGVVRDELNRHLSECGVFFAPETSTANRAMIGGMVGNNSCGANSVVYGSTREHLMEVSGILSDGSKVTFGELSIEEFYTKCKKGASLESRIYNHVQNMLSSAEVRDEIEKQFPKPSIPRRNTGYAIDLLSTSSPFIPKGKPFNFSKLIAGSEGTLLFITEVKLKVTPLPPEHKALVCAHFESIHESLRANLVGLKYKPSAIELMDHYVLECTKVNIEQRQNRFFVKGDPKAILVYELQAESEDKLNEKCAQLIEDLKEQGMGYHYPIVQGSDIKRVWNLRKAGLGLLSNIPGDAKPVPVIEDTAVDVNDLPEFIREFNLILDQYDLYCVHYANAGSGELHLRPIINLKTSEGNRLFKKIAEEIAVLVKKYKGSLSGEHGDGRLRGEFIPFMIGDKNYNLLKEIKQTWDPQGIFNPGKIVDTPPMNLALRYTPGQKTPDFDTYFDYSIEKGFLRAAELCNGSGDCRKSHLTGGTMCPSYMATKNESDTTRARANILREVLSDTTRKEPFNSEEIKAVMDLCLSCKACKSECPSNVDMARLKAEWQQKYYDHNGIPLSTQLIANFYALNSLASLTPKIYNTIVNTPFTGSLLKKVMGFATERSIPPLHELTFRKWFKSYVEKQKAYDRKVVLFIDEFTNFLDVAVGQDALHLLNGLGYGVELAKINESGRTYLSKGLVKKAAQLAQSNLEKIKEQVTEHAPLVGIEPSAILTVRDEYIGLSKGSAKKTAEDVASLTYTLEEFLVREWEKGAIRSNSFKVEKRLVKLHGHCHQKAQGALVPTKKFLSIPTNYKVELIPSGCCGMAGSFGYEKEHFQISMQIGELVLFPTVRNLEPETLIAAPGTSCRHQIKDGTQREALHPITILRRALKE
jgi:FAD/FMN-containing dehydrogenase/Fe-S oxidoreductase